MQNRSYKEIRDMLNSLPPTPMEKLKDDIFRDYYEEFDSLDDLLPKLREDIKYLQEIAEEAIAKSRSDKTSINLKDWFLNYEYDYCLSS